MADSETSTSPSAVTRRRLLSGTAAAMLVPPPDGAALPAGCRSRGEGEAPDQTLRLWRAWCRAHHITLAHCRTQQQLEARLVETVGFPPEAVLQEELAGPKMVDALLHQARWDAADARLGYSAAKRAEEHAAAHEQERAAALWTSPASSLAGVAAKLDALLCQGEWCEDCPEFPWPQLRSAFDDLLRLGGLQEFFQRAAGERASARS